MSLCVNTQAVYLGDQIWCRAQVKWVWWPQARLTPIVILKQNHKSLAGSWNQRRGAEAARVVQVRRKSRAGKLTIISGSPACLQLRLPTNPSHPETRTLTVIFMTCRCLPNPTSISPTTLHEASRYLSPYHSVNSNNSNFVVAMRRSLIFRMLLALRQIMELACSSEF